MQPTVIDLFAGAGGFGLGFKMAGYDLALALEIDKWAADTLKHNHTHLIVLQDDIRHMNTVDKILDQVPRKPHVIIGGPPCQGFSISGPARKDPNDPRNTLFLDFARWVEILKPQVFIMENVKGLLSRHNAQGEKVIDIITRTFEAFGYRVVVWVLNAAEYGVPQQRERVFVVGALRAFIPEPPKTHYLDNFSNGRSSVGYPAISLWDAISDLPVLQAREGQEEQAYTRNPHNTYQMRSRSGSETLYNHVAMKHTRRMVERFKQISWGESAADVPEEYSPRQRGNSDLVSNKVYDQNNRRLHPYKPSHTITASFYANFVHPFQHRNLTAREGARVQSFPDAYRFMGKPTVVSKKLLKREGRDAEAHLCQYNQIGNAVPPLLAQQIARHLKEYISC